MLKLGCLPPFQHFGLRAWLPLLALTKILWFCFYIRSCGFSSRAFISDWPNLNWLTQFLRKIISI